MGGHALKKTKTRRYFREEYQILATQIKKELLGLFNKTEDEILEIPYFQEKESFGDLDLLISIDSGSEILKLCTLLRDQYKLTELVRNGNVVSFPYQEFQIDLICIEKELMEMSRCYFSSNDIGMLIGRMAHSLGIKYGWQGLYYFLYNDKKTKRLRKILLSIEPSRIFQVLDLDYERYQKGFKNYEEMFIFLSKSKYFGTKIFDNSLVQSESRRRDAKRPSLDIFLKWLENNKENFPNPGQILNNSETIEFINEQFPEIRLNEIISEEREKEKENDLIHNKFNGRIIMKYFPNLQGCELGRVLQIFQTHIEIDLGLSYSQYIKSTEFNKIIDEFSQILIGTK